MTAPEPADATVTLTDAEREALCFCDDVHECQTKDDSDMLEAACDENVTRVERIVAARVSVLTAPEPADTDLRAAIEALIHSDEANKFRDEACRHAVAQPYADNRYVRLLDDLRAVLAATSPTPEAEHVVHVTAEPVAEDVVWCETCEEWVASGAPEAVSRSEGDDTTAAVARLTEDRPARPMTSWERSLVSRVVDPDFEGDDTTTALARVREALAAPEVLASVKWRLDHYGPLDAAPFQYSRFESPAHAALSAVHEALAALDAGPSTPTDPA